ncbi:MAG: HAD family hydrolase [Candidatus Bathyarchaeota archaeon]|nr:HAD family hydrolase [Candidatus Bathyarchaeota archaeon]
MGYLKEKDIKVLALDIDGTLYPKRMLNARMVRSMFPSIPLAKAFNWARKEYRRVQDLHPTSPENREGLIDRQAKLVASRLRGNRTTDQVKAAVDKQFYQAWGRSFMSIKAYPGMVGTLEEVHAQGVKVAVFSDFPLAGKLQTLGIDGLVDYAYSTEESGYLKPSAKAFSFLLDHLQVDSSQVLYMGDSYSKDCSGAKQAGMYSCLITKDTRKSFPEADLVVSSWKEFASLVL